MVAPTLVGQWRTQAEIPLPSTTNLLNTTRSTLFLLKTGLMGVAPGGTSDGVAFSSTMNWALDGSCNGVTAGMDAVDRLGGATFTASDWVRAISGAAHSWYVLSSDITFGQGGTKIYLLVSLQGSTDGQWTLSYARTPFTGGSTTANPTSTTEVAIGTNAINSPATCCADNVFNVSMYAQVTRSPGGEFFFVVNRAGTGVAGLFLHLADFRGTTVAETFPTFALTHSIAQAGRGAGVATAISNSSTGYSSRTVTNSARSTSGGLCLYHSTNTSNPFAGNMAKDGVRDEWTSLPIFVFGLETGNVCIRGHVRDIWWVGAAPVGAGYPFAAPGQQTQVVVGDMLIPSFVPAAW